MGKKKKAFEINFGTLLLIIIGICCIIFAFKNFSKEKTKAENNQNENINSTENITEEQTEEKIYSNNVISLNIGKKTAKCMKETTFFQWFCTCKIIQFLLSPNSGRKSGAEWRRHTFLPITASSCHYHYRHSWLLLQRPWSDRQNQSQS